jgi:hypothetical protein
MEEIHIIAVEMDAELNALENVIRQRFPVLCRGYFIAIRGISLERMKRLYISKMIYKVPKGILGP